MLSSPLLSTSHRAAQELVSVSYTHLDVYKRQVLGIWIAGSTYLSVRKQRIVSVTGNAEQDFESDLIEMCIRDRRWGRCLHNPRPAPS